MAVNENDRVSTRRLKEFWQTAKPWIQTLVSGAINTSEETMRSTMDTKILAAKPNYNMPNTNDQIGVGFGYNDGEKVFWKNTSGGGQVAHLSLFFNVITHTRLKACMLAEYNRNNTDITLSTFKKDFFKELAGKMALIPGEFINITSIDDIQEEWLHSTYEENNNIGYLTSPVYTFTVNGTQHTIQGRITTNSASSNNDNVSLLKKLDDGEWIGITSDLGLDNAGTSFLCARIPLQSSMYTWGYGELLDNSVTTAKIANSAVTEAKIKDGAVSGNKIASQAISTVKLNNTVKRRFLMNSGNNNILDLNYNNQKFYRNTFSSISNSNAEIYGLKIVSNTKDFFSKFTYDATYNLNMVVETGTDYFDLWNGFFTGTGINTFSLPVSQEVGDKTTPNAVSKFRGEIILEDATGITKYDVWAEKVDEKFRVHPYDTSFFTHTADDSTFELFFPLQGGTENF